MVLGEGLLGSPKPEGVCVIAQVSSLAGLDWFHFRLPGTAVPGFPVPPLRGLCIVRPTFSVDLKL